MPSREILPRARDPRPQPRHRRALRPLRRRAVPDRGHRDALGRGERRAGSSRPTAATRMQGALRGHGQRAAAPAEAAGHSRASTTSRATPSTPAAGTIDYTGGDSNGGLTGLKDKRVGIIGTGATAIQCVPHLGECGQAALRLPAHAVVGRRARQPADRSGMGRVAGAGLAAAADGQFQHPGLRRLRRTRIWSTTAGPTSSATSLRLGAQEDRAGRRQRRMTRPS